MKIRKAEVRTTYVIEYTFKDLWEIVANAKEDATNYNNVFVEYGGIESHMDEVKSLFLSFDGFNKNELEYIARKLGFDDWCHYGSYDSKKDVRTISVYNYGDTL